MNTVKRMRRFLIMFLAIIPLMILSLQADAMRVVGYYHSSSGGCHKIFVEVYDTHDGTEYQLWSGYVYIGACRDILNTDEYNNDYFSNDRRESTNNLYPNITDEHVYPLYLIERQRLLDEIVE